jgi:hypothetical protein
MTKPKEFIKSTQNNVLLEDYSLKDVEWFMKDYAKQYHKEKSWNFSKICKLHLMWSWLDFGIMLRVYNQNNISGYRFAIDIQIAWLNIWIQCWKK